MGYGSLQEDNEKRRQDADSGIDEHFARETGSREQDDPLPWRWQLEFRGQVIARIMETCHRGGWGIAGILVNSPEFETFRPYCKIASDHQWSGESCDSVHNALFEEINAQGGLHIRDLKRCVLYTDVRFQVSGQDVRFSYR
jgi:hypothetical protein